jgi:hypothetical protein
MKRLGILSTAVVMTLGLASSAHASLIFDTAIDITGTGLGAVNTLVTVHDPGGPGNNNGIEGGCILQSGATGSAGSPCLGEVTENDNTAQNNTFTFDTTLNFVAVVNISETGADPEPQATLTGLYLQFCSTTNPTQCHLAQWTEEASKLLAPSSGEGTGLGGSGFTFKLDDAQFAAVQALPGNFVTVAGGLQFASGSTNDGNDTLHVIRIEGDNVVTPEPTSLALFGVAAAMSLVRRRRSTR